MNGYPKVRRPARPAGSVRGNSQQRWTVPCRPQRIPPVLHACAAPDPSVLMELVGAGADVHAVAPAVSLPPLCPGTATARAPPRARSATRSCAQGAAGPRGSGVLCGDVRFGGDFDQAVRARGGNGRPSDVGEGCDAQLHSLRAAATCLRAMTPRRLLAPDSAAGLHAARCRLRLRKRGRRACSGRHGRRSGAPRHGRVEGVSEPGLLLRGSGRDVLLEAGHGHRAGCGCPVREQGRCSGTSGSGCGPGRKARGGEEPVTRHTRVCAQAHAPQSCALVTHP